MVFHAKEQVLKYVTFIIHTMDVFVRLKHLKDQISVLFLHFVFMPKSMTLGFIETPYRKVKDSQVDFSEDGIVWLSAEEEEEKMIAQANAPLTKRRTF